MRGCCEAGGGLAACPCLGWGSGRSLAGSARALCYLVQARDESGNKRLSGGDEFQVGCCWVLEPHVRPSATHLRLLARTALGRRGALCLSLMCLSLQVPSKG